MRALAGLVSAACLVACSRPAADAPPAPAATIPVATTSAAATAPPDPTIGNPCTSPRCLVFATEEDAFRHVLALRPRVLGIGEAHAQKGTEAVASATKRFTERFLPLISAQTSDVVVELWAPDPKCAKEVKKVANAQKVVTEVQAETNQNEYVTLGTAAKAAGVTPWLLQPTCDDFGMLADAGAADIGAMLGLVKRLTQARVTKQLERTPDRLVVAYGGTLHNDLAPPEATRAWSFGPELDRLTDGHYVELDLIVPEYVKPTPSWQKLPWYDAFTKEPHGRPLLFEPSPRSFVLVFPETTPAK